MLRQQRACALLHATPGNKHEGNDQQDWNKDQEKGGCVHSLYGVKRPQAQRLRRLARWLHDGRKGGGSQRDSRSSSLQRIIGVAVIG